eukprot:gene35358-43600_t
MGFPDVTTVFAVATDPAFLVRKDNEALNPSTSKSQSFGSYSTNAFKTGNSANPLKPSTFTGVGGVSQQQQLIQHVQESFSVYVSNLPLDITEEEIEILFGSSALPSQGKLIKKIRLYTTPSGQKKGDALIQFTKTEYAYTACIKFNGLDIDTAPPSSTSSSSGKVNTSSDSTSFQPSSSGRFLHSVSANANDIEHEYHNLNNHTKRGTEPIKPMQFTSSSSSSSSSGGHKKSRTSSELTQRDSDTSLTNDVFHQILPPESEASQYPVTVIRNVFDSAMGGDDFHGAFFDDLEADMLIECCKFGKVRFIQLLTPCAVLREGSIAVTFDTQSAAEDCAATLQGRFFDCKQLVTHVVLPKHMVKKVLPSHIPPPPPPPRFACPKSVVLTSTSTVSKGSKFDPVAAAEAALQAEKARVQEEQRVKLLASVSGYDSDGGGENQNDRENSKMIRMQKQKEEAKKESERQVALEVAEAEANGKCDESAPQQDIAELDGGKAAQIDFPNPNDLTNFIVTVTPDSGYWCGGAKYPFTFVIPALYPHEPPKGNVCLNILREDWKPVLDINAVIYGLIYLFYEPNPDDPLNREAADLFRNNKAEFA